MPGMDGTGPFGTGPVGRGSGPCRGGSAGQFSRGWGRNFRRGGGFGWNTMNLPSANEEITLLEQQKSWLESQIEALKTRLASLNQGNNSGT